MAKNSITRVLVGVLVLIVVFTFLDYLFHQLPLFGVSQQYFVNKVLFGTPIALFAYYGFRNVHDVFRRSLFQATTLTLLLQTRYLFTYNLEFNVGVVVAHFIILVPLYYVLHQSRLLS